MHSAADAVIDYKYGGLLGRVECGRIRDCLLPHIGKKLVRKRQFLLDLIV